MKMLEVLEKVLVQAMKKEPRAWLYEVQSVMKETDDGQVHPEDLYQMKIVFGMPAGHTLIYEINSDEKITETVVESSWGEDRPIPHRIADDLEAAFKRLKQANLLYDEICPEVFLRHSLHPGAIEPAYYFGARVNGKIEHIYVGLFSNDVILVK